MKKMDKTVRLARVAGIALPMLLLPAVALPWSKPVLHR